MNRRTTLFFTGLTVVGIIANSSTSFVYATTPPPSNPQNVGQALEIAPPVVNLNVNPGQTTSTVIYLRDISRTNLIVTGQTNDFIAAGEDGTPKVLLNTGETSPYSLKDWVQTPPNLTLIPREIKAMTVTIVVPRNASPGGHYGIIRFTATPPGLDSTGVSLSASLGALLLVSVSGDIHENVKVQELSVNQNGKTSNFFENAPLNFVEVFSNTGNVHELPTGQVVINDMFGHKFAAVNVNLPPHNILPSSLRKFEEPLDNTVIGNKVMFGRYTATLSASYGTSKHVLTSTVVFWVIPYRIIIGSIVGLIGVFFGLRLIIRRYNRYIISQVQKHQS
jgi:hypothetical protein